MKKQLKLFQLYSNSYQTTLSKLNEYFPDRMVIFPNNVVGIQYDFRENRMYQIIDKVYELNLDISDFIFNSVRMYQILKKAVCNNISIKIMLDTSDSDEDYTQTIKAYLAKIEYGDTTMITNLISELKWLRDEERIEIESIDLHINDSNVFGRITLFYNGTVLFDESVLGIMKSLIELTLRPLRQKDVNWRLVMPVEHSWIRQVWGGGSHVQRNMKCTN